MLQRMLGPMRQLAMRRRQVDMTGVAFLMTLTRRGDLATLLQGMPV